MKIKIEEAVWSALHAQLFRRRDVETAGLLLVEPVDGTGKRLGLVREAFALPDSAYAVRRHDRDQDSEYRYRKRKDGQEKAGARFVRSDNRKR